MVNGVSVKAEPFVPPCLPPCWGFPKLFPETDGPKTLFAFSFSLNNSFSSGVLAPSVLGVVKLLMMAARSQLYCQHYLVEQDQRASDYCFDGGNVFQDIENGQRWDLWTRKVRTFSENGMLALFAMRDVGGDFACYRKVVVERSRLSILAIAQQWHLREAQARLWSCKKMRLAQAKVLG